MEVNILDLCSRGIFNSCFGNNAGAPYASIFLPPAPDHDLIDNNCDKPSSAQLDLNLPLYKLRPDEAVVLIGKTPPSAYYFSYRSYLGLVENQPGKEYSTVYGNDEIGLYHLLFASLGDQINNFNIWTENTPKGDVGDPFNSDTIIISTIDKVINEQVRDALGVAGYSSETMNNDNIPLDLVNIGLDKGKDIFIFLMRIAIWAQASIGQDYLDNLDNLVQVFRVTPEIPYANQTPWPIPTLKKRESGITEFEVLPTARNDLDYLRREIIKRYGTNDYEYKDLNTHKWILDGYEAILHDVAVYGDNRDAAYMRTDTFQLKSDDDFLIIYGVNHEQTGKAMFSNTSFYGVELLNGVLGVNSTILFKNSANEYFPEGYENSHYYYVYKMARKTDEDCIVIIPYSTGNPLGKAFGVDNNKDAFIGFRVYVDKTSMVGPPLFDIIRDRAILFTKKKMKFGESITENQRVLKG